MAQNTLPSAPPTVGHLTQSSRLYKYLKIEGTWKYVKADYDENYLKPHSVFLPKASTPSTIEGGCYFASDKGQWHKLCEDPREAWRLFRLWRNEGQISALQTRSRMLEAPTTSQNPEKPVAPKVLTLGDSIKNFLASYRLKVLAKGRKPRTYDAIEDILVAFRDKVGANHPLQNITRETVITYIAGLKTKRGRNAERSTKANHHLYIAKLLKDKKTGLGTDLFESGDCPKAPSGNSEDIRVYSDEEIRGVLSASSDYLKMCWKTFLMSGMREEELTHLYKTDVRQKTDGSWIIRVEAKPDLRDWTPKTSEERDINIPASLAAELIEFSKVYMPECKLLFPTAPRYGAKGCKVNGRLLDGLKRCADRAGLNQDEFWLHAFRSTYATRCLRAGMSIPDVRKQLGHAPNSNTIWKYVAAARGAERQKAVELVFPEFS